MQAHTAIKNSGASQRDTEARIAQAHKELASEQEAMRRAHEDRTAAEARWAEEVGYGMSRADQLPSETAVRTRLPLSFLHPPVFLFVHGPIYCRRSAAFTTYQYALRTKLAAIVP